MKISARHILPWLLLAAACCVPAKQSERESALPPPKPVRVRLLFGGDVMQHLPQVTAARPKRGSTTGRCSLICTAASVRPIW